MAFNATKPLVIDRLMLKFIYVEIGVKLAVDSREKIAD